MKIKRAVILMAIIFTIILAGCMKVYTQDGVGHNEGIPCGKNEKMRGCVRNTSTFYDITFYPACDVGFELKPGQYSPEFEKIADGDFVQCHIKWYRDNHGFAPSEGGEEDLKFPLNFTKKDRITPDGRVLDFYWEWAGPGGVATGGWHR